MIDGIPLPVTDDQMKPFFDGYAAGELRVPHCAPCDRLAWPPRPNCPQCHGKLTQWTVMSGRGTIWSFVVPHPPLLPAFNPVAPYNVITVQLEEDPQVRIVSNLVTSADGAINEVDPASITLGEPVKAIMSEIAPDIFMPRFVRV